MRAKEIYLSHFGRFTDIEEHLADLEVCLLEWTAWIRNRLGEDEPQDTVVSTFSDYVTAGPSPIEARSE